MKKIHLHHAIALNQAEKEIYLEATGKMKNILPGRTRGMIKAFIGPKYAKGIEEMCIFTRFMLKSYENLEELSKDEKDEKLLGKLTCFTDAILHGPPDEKPRKKKRKR